MKTSKNSQIVLQVGVKALIINKNKEVLILKRNQNFYKNVNDLWDIPGGRINADIGLISNLKREINEETGLKNIKGFTIIAAQDIIKFEKYVVRLTYVSRATSTIKIVLSTEHVEYKWVSVDKLLKIKGLDKYVREFVKDKKQMSFIKNYIK